MLHPTPGAENTYKQWSQWQNYYIRAEYKKWQLDKRVTEYNWVTEKKKQNLIQLSKLNDAKSEWQII